MKKLLFIDNKCRIPIDLLPLRSSIIYEFSVYSEIVEMSKRKIYSKKIIFMDRINIRFEYLKSMPNIILW